MEDFGDIPIGLTPFDEWMSWLFMVQYRVGFLKLTDMGSLDRDHWQQYYDDGYSPEDAFEEDLTCYGD